MTTDPQEISTEERIFSAVSHASTILPYLGVIAPLAIWITQREKSEWLRFQALQALTYQIFQIIIVMLGSCLIMPLMIGAMLFDYDSEVVLMSITMLITFIPYIIWGLLILLGLGGGVSCAFGHTFSYPIMGKRIARYLEFKYQSETSGGNHD